MLKTCDLHTHSVFSDGTYTPTEIVRHAAEIGLSAVALTDHNTADGLLEFLEAAKGLPLEAVAGTEFSVEYEGGELHLLGLFLPPKYFAQIAALMKEADLRKEESNYALIEALNRAGYHLEYEELKKATPKGRFNRAHVGAALTAKGYTESIDQAFRQLLSPKAGYYVPPKRLRVWEVLDFIQTIEGVPVLAHPYLNLSEERLVKFLPEAKKCGLAGMECMYSLYDENRTRRSLEIAKAVGICPSGGSDFHGKNKPEIMLGTGKGNLEIPYAWYEALRKKEND